MGHCNMSPLHIAFSLALMFAINVHVAAAETLFSESGPLTASQGTIITTVDIGDQMHYEMDITVHSVQSSGWTSIFHCGNDEYTRMPAIYLDDTADNVDGTWEGFYFAYTTATSDQWGLYDGRPGPVMDALVAGQTYHVQIDWTQSWIRIEVDGEAVWEVATSEHVTRQDLPCYLSNPWSTASDVSVTNLIISTDVPCNFNGSSGCGPHLTCDAETGTCGRNCAAFQIDEYLLDCSAEFESNEHDIGVLESNITSMSGDIAAIHRNMAVKSMDISSLNDSVHDLLSAIREIEGFLDQYRVSSAQLQHAKVDTAGAATEGSWASVTAKDVLLFGLLTVNMAATVVMIVFYWKRPSMKNYEVVDSVSIAAESERENLQ